MTTAAISGGKPDAQKIIERAIGRYIAERHAKVDAFVARNYGLIGSIRLHRHALGWDLVRAPANVALVAPALAARLTAAGLDRVGMAKSAKWLRGRRMFLATDVAAELEWRLHTELLELPRRMGDRSFDRDALMEAVLADPEVEALLEGLEEEVVRHRDDPEAKERLRILLDSYSGTRNAVAEILNNVAFAGTGAAAFKQLTPSALSLGPVLATTIAHQAAVASFPLGAGAGSLWYGWFAVQPSAALVASVTGGLMLAAAVSAAFMGVVADPLQKALGVHQRRLHRLVDALEGELRGGSQAAFDVREHYVARVFDLFDVGRASLRLLRSAAGG